MTTTMNRTAQSTTNRAPRGPRHRVHRSAGPRTPELSEVYVVSATSMSVRAEPRGMVRPTVPNYALRRAAAAGVAVVALAVAAVGVLGLAAGFGGAPASAAEAAPSEAAAMHVAAPGDTLWSIAARYRGDVAHDRYLDALVRANGSPSIQAGQAVWLP